MTTVTKTQLANLAGVTRQAVYKAVVDNRIPTLPDGRIDADDAAVRHYININREAKGNNNSYKNGRKHKTVQEAQVIKFKPADTPKRIGRPPTSNAEDARRQKVKDKKAMSKGGRVSLMPPSSTDGMTIPKTRSGYTDLEKVEAFQLDDIKLRAQIRKLEIESNIKEGKYVDRQKVEAFASAIWTIDSSEWTQLGNKIASELVGVVRSCADVNEAERQVIQLIDRAVYASLQHEKSKLLEWSDKLSMPIPVDDTDIGDTDSADDDMDGFDE